MGRMAQWPSAIATLAYITMLLSPPRLPPLPLLQRQHLLLLLLLSPHQLPPRIAMP